MGRRAGLALEPRMLGRSASQTQSGLVHQAQPDSVRAGREPGCSVEAVGFLLLPRDRMSLKLMEVVTELKVNNERVMAMESDGGSNSGKNRKPSYC
ncbi:hypothetical protein V6N11_082860 [Hibiscus sabdariffa]|uniref:Uncharacterized protein n=1 Tax=Hibiscus sabdariffa TaxID=183260 RepID=A0ABR2QK54_9ROSI